MKRHCFFSSLMRQVILTFESNIYVFGADTLKHMIDTHKQHRTHIEAQKFTFKYVCAPTNTHAIMSVCINCSRSTLFFGFLRSFKTLYCMRIFPFDISFSSAIYQAILQSTVNYGDFFCFDIEKYFTVHFLLGFIV